MQEGLDVVIVGTNDNEQYIKSNMVQSNSHFYLTPSKREGSSTDVLWYDSYSPKAYGFPHQRGSSIRVRILLPASTDIPSFRTEYITRINCLFRAETLPSVPFSLALLLKLKTWSFHRAGSERGFSKEEYKDWKDIEQLVPIACAMGIRPMEEPFISANLSCKAQELVHQYVKCHPTSKTLSGWKSMGFSVLQAPGGPGKGRGSSKKKKQASDITHRPSSTLRGSQFSSHHAQIAHDSSLGQCTHDPGQLSEPSNSSKGQQLLKRKKTKRGNSLLEASSLGTGSFPRISVADIESLAKELSKLSVKSSSTKETVKT